MTGHQDSTLSTDAAASRPSTEVIALGKRLSTELGLDRSCQTLSKWLAQLLAEKIGAAETATDVQQKQQYEQQAVSLILRIWQERYIIPPCARPFARLARAFEVLGSIRDRETDWLAAFRARKEESNAWERMIVAVEAFRSQLVPCLALGQIAVEPHGDLLEWEEKHREMFEAVENNGVDLLRGWLNAFDKDPDGDPEMSSARSKRVSKVLSKVDESVRQLLTAIESFKAEIAAE